MCAVLAPGRVNELERSAKSLSDGKAGEAVDDSLALRLLHDLHGLWPGGEAYWPTVDILAKLKAGLESPWAGEIELNPRRLARMLKPFEIESRDVRTGSGTRKGYVFDEIRVAHSRYIGPESATSATDRTDTGENCAL